MRYHFDFRTIYQSSLTQKATMFVSDGYLLRTAADGGPFRICLPWEHQQSRLLYGKDKQFYGLFHVSAYPVCVQFLPY